MLIANPATLPDSGVSAAVSAASSRLGSNHSLPVPEPSTLFFVGTGLVGLALTARRRRRPEV